MGITTIITPDIIGKLAENGILILFIFFLFIFIYFIYNKYLSYNEKIKKEEMELKKLEMNHKEKVTSALEESIILNKVLREEIKDQDRLIKHIKKRNKEHKFKIVKHVKNAKNETEIILQCPNCKENGEIVLNELTEIESTANRSIEDE